MMMVRGFNAAIPLNARNYHPAQRRELYSDIPRVSVATSSASGLYYLVSQCLFGEA